MQKNHKRRLRSSMRFWRTFTSDCTKGKCGRVLGPIFNPLLVAHTDTRSRSLALCVLSPLRTTPVTHEPFYPNWSTKHSGSCSTPNFSSLQRGVIAAAGGCDVVAPLSPSRFLSHPTALSFACARSLTRQRYTTSDRIFSLLL